MSSPLSSIRPMSRAVGVSESADQHSSALHGPGFGSKSGSGLCKISRAGPGLYLLIAGPGWAWAEKILNMSGLGRAWA